MIRFNILENESETYQPLTTATFAFTVIGIEPVEKKPGLQPRLYVVPAQPEPAADKTLARLTLESRSHFSQAGSSTRAVAGRRRYLEDILKCHPLRLELSFTMPLVKIMKHYIRECAQADSRQRSPAAMERRITFHRPNIAFRRNGMSKPSETRHTQLQQL